MNDTNFIISDLMAARECNHENYQFIDTIRLEREITQVCSDIIQKIGVDYISCCLVVPGGTRFIISNNPGKIAIPYRIHGLDRIDNAFSAERYKKNTSGVFVPSEIPNDSSGYLFEKISKEFGIQNTIGFFRSFQGYQFFTIFSQDRNNNIATSCQPKEKDLYDYVVRFYDQLLLAYAQSKPQLKYSRFYQEASFRNKLIRGECEDISIHFTERELQCLYWTRTGKTVEDISVTTGLGKAAVQGYLESIREKCCVGSIQEAVFWAIQQKFIS